MLAECRLDPSDENEHVFHALRLGRRVANERRAQAPVLLTRPFGEVDEPGEFRRCDVGHRDSLRNRQVGPALRSLVVTYVVLV